MEDAPANSFFLEYLARPQTAEMFFEDVLMAIVFYGMPILIDDSVIVLNVAIPLVNVSVIS